LLNINIFTESISFNPYFENFINKLIEEGKYNSVSEVVRAGLHLLEKNERKHWAIVEALKKGEER